MKKVFSITMSIIAAICMSFCVLSMAMLNMILAIIRDSLSFAETGDINVYDYSINHYGRLNNLAIDNINDAINRRIEKNVHIPERTV